MQVLDATSLAERRACEDKDYCLRLESDMPLEKYPGEHCSLSRRARHTNLAQPNNMRAACKKRWASSMA